MGSLPNSNLLLNRDGSVRHLNLKPEHISDVIITVGDPLMVFKVSQFFNDVDFEMNKRDYITQIGNYKGKKVTVISSGMGADNIEILLMELDLLANFDLKTKKEKLPDAKKTLKIIRLGTSVGLQDIPLGSHIYSNYSVGFDSLMQFYNLSFSDEFEREVTTKLEEMIHLPFKPYCSKGSEVLMKHFAYDMREGNSLALPGFYAPQGRYIRIPLKYPKFVNDFTYFHYKDFWVTNFEMETAAYYALGKLLGHEMLSMSVITENILNNTVSKNADQELEGLIKKVLDRI